MHPDDTSQREVIEALRASIDSLRAEVVALRADVIALVPSDAPALTVEQAARMLGAGRTRVFELLEAGKLRPAGKVGRSRMITAASVKALLEEEDEPGRSGDVSRAPLGLQRASGHRR